VDTPKLRNLAIAAGVTLLLAAGAAQAQTASRSVRPATQSPAPANAGTIAMPSPNGLASPFAHPEGLPDPNPVNLASPGTPAGSPVVDAGVAKANVAGAGVAPAPTPGRAVALAHPGPYTPLEIAASFLGADLNHDGELTRAEADHLAIAPYNFDELDRNHDGVITRFEYEDAFK